ncbi:MAG: Kelch repeat-containing protein [Thermoplasmatota archaeon]
MDTINKSEETKVKSIDTILDVNNMFDVSVSDAVYTGNETAYVLGVKHFNLETGNDLIHYIKYNLSSYRIKTIKKDHNLPFAPLSTVYTGEDIFIFGGQVYGSQSNTDNVYRLNIDNEKLEKLEVELPEEITEGKTLFQFTSVWIQDRAFLIYEDGVYSFYPSNHTFQKYELEHLDELFSKANNRNSVYAEGKVYFFNQDKIFCFDPEERTLNELDKKLPTNYPKAWRRSAVYTGEYIYIIGGGGFGREIIDEIIRFDPETNEAELLNTKLPVKLHGCNPVCDGEYIYIFSGRKKRGVSDSYKGSDDITFNDTYGAEMNVIWRFNYQDLSSNDEYPGIKYDYSTEYTAYGSLCVSIVITTLILMFRKQEK